MSEINANTDHDKFNENDEQSLENSNPKSDTSVENILGVEGLSQDKDLPKTLKSGSIPLPENTLDHQDVDKSQNKLLETETQEGNSDMLSLYSKDVSIEDGNDNVSINSDALTQVLSETEKSSNNILNKLDNISNYEAEPVLKVTSQPVSTACNSIEAAPSSNVELDKNNKLINEVDNTYTCNIDSLILKNPSNCDLQQLSPNKVNLNNSDKSVENLKNTGPDSINQVAPMDEPINKKEKSATDTLKESQNISNIDIVDDKENNQTETDLSNAVILGVVHNSNLKPENKNKDNIDRYTGQVEDNEIQQITSMDIENFPDTRHNCRPHYVSNHNLHRPDVMLEIPTHGLIELDDILDSPNTSKDDDDATCSILVDETEGIFEKSVEEVTMDKKSSEEESDKHVEAVLIESSNPILVKDSEDLNAHCSETYTTSDEQDKEDGENVSHICEIEVKAAVKTILENPEHGFNICINNVAFEEDNDSVKHKEEYINAQVDLVKVSGAQSESSPSIKVFEGNLLELREVAVNKENKENDVTIDLANNMDIDKNNTMMIDEESQNKKEFDRIEDEIINSNDNSEKEDNLGIENGDVIISNNYVEKEKSSSNEDKSNDDITNSKIDDANNKVDTTQHKAAITDGSPIQSNTSDTLTEEVQEESTAIPIYNLSDSDNDEDQVTTEPEKNDAALKTTEEVPRDVAQPTNSTDNTSSAEVKNKKIINNVIDIVDLRDTSSEEDVQDADKIPQASGSSQSPNENPINLPTDNEVEASSSEGIMKPNDNVLISTESTQQKSISRLNSDEESIETASGSEQTLLMIPEETETSSDDVEITTKSAPIYSIDSDEEDTKETKIPDQTEPEPKKKTRKCINTACSSGSDRYMIADKDTAAYYDALRKRKPIVCENCAEVVVIRKKNLIAGIKDMIPLTQLEISNTGYNDVEVLDSESEDEEPQPEEEQAKETIGEETAKFLEENLAEILNSTWKKYDLDERLKVTEDELNSQIAKLEVESKEINDMLIECQRMTDKLRNDFYGTFEPRIEEEPPLVIYETPEFQYYGPEKNCPATPSMLKTNVRTSKRKTSVTNTGPMPAKRPAVIALGYAPLHDPRLKVQESKIVTNEDDDIDVSVVNLSAESPPPELPPSGELVRPPLQVDMHVYAMKNAYGSWLKGRITEIMPKGASTFTLCRVQFDHITKSHSKILPARCIAYDGPANVRMTIGTRLIALFQDSNKRESYSSGVVAEAPTPVNNFRYLVFFDDGYAQYVKHPFTRVVCESSPQVWEEVHPYSRDFVKEYLMAFPERPMVRLRQGQNFKTEWNGKWLASRVIKVDASLVQVVFLADGRREWIYRGSTRLAPLYMELKAAERQRPRVQGSRGRQQPRTNMPYVEYTRAEEQSADLPPVNTAPVQQPDEEGRRQRAVAKKSTTSSNMAAPQASSGLQPVGGGKTTQDTSSVISRVVYYTPKKAVKPSKLVAHTCSPQCKRTVLSLEELRTYNPLAKPLLSGWERQTVRYKYTKEVMYRAPCGRRLRNIRELHRYLQLIDSELSVDLFDFNSTIHCLAEFQINKCLTGKKDLSQGKENVPVPCVNYYDQTLPEFCLYNTERTPTSGVPLNLDPEFLCGCDCTDDCEDKSKCACWKMTLEGAQTIGMDTTNLGYVYKRLPEPLPSGIYECNSRCKCKQTCLNRVAQHPLQLKLQVFKTLNRGWGIRALNDVPKGAFLCVYAGNLLTDATANLDGLNEGDEYLAELDYIEVVEQMKEGYEADIPESEKNLEPEQSESIKQEETAEQSPSSSDEGETSNNDKDDDFMPGGHIESSDVTKFNKHLRKRSREEEAKEKEKDSKDKADNEFITISDDEEVREPSRFAAQTGMGGNEFISKYRSVRTLFGEDEACYIMDAKVQGNIGRYLNHSCSPNVFVQNVFVDTHDPRFPWVAFFALSDIKAGTELTWNYNYDVGSVPGKVLYCYCQAPNCRGRLL